MWQDRVVEFLSDPNWQNDHDWQITSLLKNDIQNYRN